MRLLDSSSKFLGVQNHGLFKPSFRTLVVIFTVTKSQQDSQSARTVCSFFGTSRLCARKKDLKKKPCFSQSLSLSCTPTSIERLWTGISTAHCSHPSIPIFSPLPNHLSFFKSTLPFTPLPTPIHPPFIHKGQDVRLRWRPCSQQCRRCCRCCWRGRRCRHVYCRRKPEDQRANPR